MKFTEWLNENKMDESVFDFEKLKSVIKKFSLTLEKHVKDENIMEIHGEFNSFKKTIDAWLPLLTKELTKKK